MSLRDNMGEKEQDPLVAFQKVREKALSLGLTADQLNSLQSVRSLKAPRAVKAKTWKTVDWDEAILYGIKALLVLTCLCLLLSISFLLEWPLTKRQYLEKYFQYYDQDIDREPCIIEWNDKVIDFVRPPVDCSICKGISRVEKVANISPEEFEEKWAYSGTPVVITDAMTNWTATETFSFEFFKSIYGEDSPAIRNQDQKCQFFPYKSDFGNLAEVFNMSVERAQLKDGAKPWYIGWSNCDSTAANILRQHYQKPYFLPRIAESSKTDWIFMGSPGYGAHMHIDNVVLPSWQAQVTGTKLWTLEPSPECYHVCESSVEVVVNPGEIIVLDTNRWFHSTLIKGDEMSITIGSEYD